MEDLRAAARAAVGEGHARYNENRLHDALAAYNRAIEIYKRIDSEAPCHENSRELAEVYRWAFCVLSNLGRHDEAVNLGFIYLSIYDGLSRATGEREDKRHYALAHSLLGDSFTWMGDSRRSLDYYKRFVELLEAVRYPMNRQIMIDIAEGCGRVGLASNNIGDHSTAREYFLRAKGVIEEAFSPAECATNSTLAWININLRHTCISERDYTAAEGYNLAAIAIRRNIFAAEGSIRARVDLASDLREMAIVAYYQCNEAKAMPYYLEGIALIEDELTRTRSIELLSNLCRCYDAYAGALEFFGKRVEATSYLERCIDLRCEILSISDSFIARHELAFAYYRLAETDRGERARVLLPEAIALWTDLSHQYAGYTGWLTAANNLLNEIS